MSRQPARERTHFDITVENTPWTGRVEVFRHGRRVFNESVGDADPDGITLGYEVWYDWSCNRTGAHEWRVTVTEPVAYGQPETKTETKRGTFRVGRCGKTRPRRLSRGTAAYKASGGEGGWGNEFVSSVRCSRAAHWQANREKVNAAKRAQRARNSQLHRAQNLAWNKRNPEKIRAARERYAARQRAARDAARA